LKLSKTIGIVAILFLIYFLFLIFSDIEKIFSTLMNVEKNLLFGGFVFWLLGAVARVLRWHFFLRSITKKIPFIKSSLYFLAGFAFILSPARAGEMIRSPIIKRDYNISSSKTAPIVVIERFYDLLAVTIIIAIGLLFIDIEKTIIIIPIAFIVLVLIVIKNKKLVKKLFIKITKFRILNKITLNVDESFDVMYNLLHPKYFTAGLATSLTFAIFEVVGVYLFLIGLSGDIRFEDLVVLFHAANFAASASMIPAGIGVLEGGFIGLLVLYDVEYEVAFSTTIATRLASTVMFTIIGMIALHLVSNKKET
jgi:uncharacterized protein (TIRG00374 family)